MSHRPSVPVRELVGRSEAGGVKCERECLGSFNIFQFSQLINIVKLNVKWLTDLTVKSCSLMRPPRAMARGARRMVTLDS